MALTKLMQWALAFAAFTGVWAMLVANAAQPHNYLHNHELLVLSLPIILIGLFGVCYDVHLYVYLISVTKVLKVTNSFPSTDVCCSYYPLPCIHI